MGISSEVLQRIVQVLSGPQPLGQRVAEVRAGFPDVAVTRCDASDMDTTPPFYTGKEFSVYLIDRSSHCWQVTPDPGKASGIIIAQ
jgi:hypothetical protein